MPATKSLRSGTCASTLLPTIRSACAALGDAAPRRARRRRTRPGSERPCRCATSATLAAGSMPSTGHAERQEMLQQIAVVARQLDHEAVRPEPEPLRDHLAVAPGRARPSWSSRTRSRRIRGRCAPGSRTRCSWTRKHCSQTSAWSGKYGSIASSCSAREEALAQRRHAEIDQGVRERAAAQPAAPHACRCPPPAAPRARARSCARPGGAGRAPRRSSRSSPLPMDSKIAGTTSSAGDQRRRYQDRGCRRA